MNDEQENRLLRAVRDELDRGAASLDDLALARLRAARRRALDARPRRTWLVAGGIAAGALAAGLAAILMLTPTPAPPVPGLEQMDLLSAADLDLYKDLEFYHWLADDNDAG
jgi:hypothetical protein